MRVTWSPRARRELDVTSDTSLEISQPGPPISPRGSSWPPIGSPRIRCMVMPQQWGVRGRLSELHVADTRCVVIYASDTSADEVVIVRGVVHGARLRDTD